MLSKSYLDRKWFTLPLRVASQSKKYIAASKTLKWLLFSRNHHVLNLGSHSCNLEPPWKLQLRNEIGRSGRILAVSVSCSSFRHGLPLRYVVIVINWNIISGKSLQEIVKDARTYNEMTSPLNSAS
jgi:hypothetical protein